MDAFKRASLGEGFWKDPGEPQPKRRHMHRQARAKLKAALRREPTEPDLYAAEIRLIACDAGDCDCKGAR